MTNEQIYKKALEEIAAIEVEFITSRHSGEVYAKAFGKAQGIAGRSLHDVSETPSNGNKSEGDVTELKVASIKTQCLECDREMTAHVLEGSPPPDRPPTCSDCRNRCSHSLGWGVAGWVRDQVLMYNKKAEEGESAVTPVELGYKPTGYYCIAGCGARKEEAA